MEQGAVWSIGKFLSALWVVQYVTRLYRESVGIVSTTDHPFITPQIRLHANISLWSANGLLPDITQTDTDIHRSLWTDEPDMLHYAKHHRLVSFLSLGT